MNKLGSLLLLCISLQGYAQLDSQSKEFLRSNAAIISQENQLNQANWEPISGLVEGKRLVLLGEFNHGSKEVFQYRNDLVKYLHENHGFDVVLFESGVGELAAIESQKKILSADQLTSGFFGGWRTPEFQDLMSYAVSEGVSLAGFDVQKTGSGFLDLLKGWDTNASSRAQSLENDYQSIQLKLTQRKALYDSLSTKTLGVIARYDLLISEMKISDWKSEMIQRTLQNRRTYLSYMLQFLQDRDWNKRWAARDSAMASNVNWLINTYYKDQKVILIAHNFHISRYSEKELSMGEVLSETYEDQLVSVGFFAAGGTYVDNAGRPQEMVPSDTLSLDIKEVIKDINGFISYIKIPEQRQAGDSWLFEAIVVNDTFIDLSNSNQLSLSRAFDGLVFIQRVSPSGE